MALKQAEFARQFSFEHLQEANAISFQCDELADKANAFKRALQRFFPEVTGGRKLYLFNLLEDGEDSFRHHAVGGQLIERTTQGVIYPLRGSLTAYAIKERKGVVFISDARKAEKLGVLRSICQESRCALACPIAFQNKCYGVLVVKSDRFDLFPETHGRLLEVLAAEAGAVFAKRGFDLPPVPARCAND
jgi:transcriptional regulator with GAF, ATPase, and Fis domain